MMGIELLGWLVALCASVTAFVLYKKLKEMENFAFTDKLTGIMNRRSCEERIIDRLKWADREIKPLSLGIVDIDHFKRINDTYGHGVGDSVLKAVAACIAGVLRETDTVARWGGEEFVLLLPNATARDAVKVFEKVRVALQELSRTEEYSAFREVTVSMGVAEYTPRAAADRTETAKELLTEADGALYRAKEEGRDRLVVGTRQYA